ncbi:HD domain-containing protein [Prolixibacteraceae bacterium JC049]|nr:HD domain-containing protein [Prolixibacteraceae bacterium JC049]
MNTSKSNKQKIINDPVFGFIRIDSDLIFDLIAHPFIQRLRRIKQLGLSCLVFPGANHSRFEHTLGALHLMKVALTSLKNKGVEITKEEEVGAQVAILLHDVGHAPFSHALEHSVTEGIGHEVISGLFMKRLNEEFRGKLTLGIEIFKNKYSKKFLHQLVASQLDVDRLDFLRRDSFFSGVTEGTVGSERIIKMLNVRQNSIVVEHKGIYSIEKFLLSRRLMYWQVYQHKAVLAAEYMLMSVLKRARYLVQIGVDIFATPALEFFLKNNVNLNDLKSCKGEKDDALGLYARLDDSDIYSALKVWQYHDDPVLSVLSYDLTNRNLWKVKMGNKAISSSKIDTIHEKVMSHFEISKQDANFLVVRDTVKNRVYAANVDKIKILYKNGKLGTLDEVSDLDWSSLIRLDQKQVLCYPRQIGS